MVERILNHCDVEGVQKSYLIHWCDYSPTCDNWEARVQLIDDILGLIERYDESHPLRSKKGLR
uniref:Chromo domain-containing protein n=1 Tax=Peronospora matthiolae TaxID=2874970 RepID=A0AAV1UQW2_9STRA